MIPYDWSTYEPVDIPDSTVRYLYHDTIPGGSLTYALTDKIDVFYIPLYDGYYSYIDLVDCVHLSLWCGSFTSQSSASQSWSSDFSSRFAPSEPPQSTYDIEREFHRQNSNSHNPSSFNIDASPNPFNSSCNISSNVLCDFEIYSIDGQIIQEITNTTFFVWNPEENLPSGDYFIRANSTNEAITSLTTPIKIVYLK